MSIASLLPSATEIICELGLRSRLVAVSHSCDRPVDIAGLPVLTRSLLDPDMPLSDIDRAVSAAAREGLPLYHVRAELLAELAPELIVTQGLCSVCAVTPGVAQPARSLSDCLPMGGRLLSLEGRTLEGILDDVLAVAGAAGVPERGKALTGQARADWQAVQEAPHAPKVLTLEWTEPPFTGGHWVPEQVERAGGVNVFGKAGQDSRRVTWPQIEASDPDVVVVMCCGYGLTDNAGFAASLLRHPQASRLRAVREGQLWATDADAHFSRPSLGVVRGAQVMSALLHGQALKGESVRVLAV